MVPRSPIHRSTTELLAYVGVLTGPLLLATAWAAWRPAPEREACAVAAESARPTLVETIAIPVPTLVSVQAPPTPPSAPRLSGDFFFVTEHGVALDLAAPRQWSQGPIRGDGNDEDDAWGQVTAFRDAKLDALPAAVQGSLDAEFDLYGPKGRVCRARLATPRLVAQFNGSDIDMVFDELPALMEQLYESEEPDPKLLRKAARLARRKVFDNEPRWLVAPFEAIGPGSCDGALWARDASLPLPLVLEPAPRLTSAARKARRDLMGSARVAEMKADYAQWRERAQPDYAGEVPTWDALVDETLEVEAWNDPDGVTRVAHARVGDFFSVCGEGFGDGETRVYQVDGSRPELVRTSAAPIAAFDLDLDGHFEWMWQTHEGVHLETREESDNREAAVYFHGCPC